ncbi:MAG: hypothetical protein RMJ60_00165 [Anaerolineales bacterium]|nr:hypothetical protein [Anaerolineales bacterium]
MRRDFTFWVLVLVFGMPVLFVLFIAALNFIPCGFAMDCSQVALPEIIHTPIPTLIPASMPIVQRGGAGTGGAKCAVPAMTVLEAWVNAGYPETDAFQFVAANGATCEATFDDVMVLFKEGNLWYSGAPACVTCHHSNITAAAANLDMSSYAGILAGSRRASPEAKGNDILGGGVWLNSMLYEVLTLPSGNQRAMPLGRPPGAFPEGGPVVLLGQQVVTP